MSFGLKPIWTHLRRLKFKNCSMNWSKRQPRLFFCYFSDLVHFLASKLLEQRTKRRLSVNRPLETSRIILEEFKIKIFLLKRKVFLHLFRQIPRPSSSKFLQEWPLPAFIPPTTPPIHCHFQVSQIHSIKINFLFSKSHKSKQKYFHFTT